MEISARAAQLSPSLTLSIDSKAKAMKAEGSTSAASARANRTSTRRSTSRRRAIAALEAGFTKYTPSAGLPELRQAIAEKLEADNQISLSPEPDRGQQRREAFLLQRHSRDLPAGR